MAEDLARAPRCEDVVALASALLDGELEPAARLRVQVHLDHCPRCRAHLRQLRAVIRLASSLSGGALSRPVIARLVRRFRRRGGAR